MVRNQVYMYRFLFGPVGLSVSLTCFWHDPIIFPDPLLDQFYSEAVRHIQKSLAVSLNHDMNTIKENETSLGHIWWRGRGSLDLVLFRMSVVSFLSFIFCRFFSFMKVVSHSAYSRYGSIIWIHTVTTGSVLFLDSWMVLKWSGGVCLELC